MKKFALSLICVLGFVGCSDNQDAVAPSDVVIQKVDKDDLRQVMQENKMSAGFEMAPEAVFSAVGEGVPPMDTISPAQARALAKRAAIADAQRQLASKLYGVKINAKDTVKDAMLQSSTIDARVSGLIKNAAIISQDFKDGLYRVEMELKMDADKWRELFTY